MKKIDQAMAVASGQGTTLDQAVKVLDKQVDFERLADTQIDGFKSFLGRAVKAKSPAEVKAADDALDKKYHDVLDSFDNDFNTISSEYQKARRKLQLRYEGMKQEMFTMYRGMGGGK